MTGRGRPASWPRLGHTRGRLTLLSFIAAVPIAAMAATIAWQEYLSVSRGSQERATLLDGQALARYNMAVAAVVGRLAADLPQVTGGTCNAGIGPILDKAGLAGLLTANLDGKIICQVGMVPPMPAGPRRWLEQVRGGQPVAVDAVGPKRVPIIAMHAGSGEVAAAVLKPDWFATNALPDASEPRAVTWLLDPDQHVLVSRGDAPAALPRLPTMIRLVGSQQGSLRANSERGLRFAYATTLLPGGFRLIAAVSADREHAAALGGLLLRMAELAVLWAAGLAAMVLGADVAFGNPLRRLSQAVRRWQTGAAFNPGDLAGAPDEVLDLASCFRDATAVLRDKEAELVRSQEQQNLLVLEVHHRVKNNLQVIASLLNLQASRIRVPEARAEFQAARDRVRALATLHRHLYADGGLHTINMRSFLTELCGQLFQAMGEEENDRIKLSIEAPELRMSSDQAVPLALIVTEAVTNSVKYAFPGGRSGHVSVNLTEQEGAMDLVISDDGVGIPVGKSETESGTRDGIGLQLIRGFARQLGGSLSVQQGPGTRYAVRLSPQPDGAGARLDARTLERDSVA